MQKNQQLQVIKLQKQLLKWFDKHRRVMPWRALKGQSPNPYHVWLSEIMLQQTTVATVGPYFNSFIKKWPTIKKLATAELDDVLTAWAGLGYYARARNLHKCAQEICNKHNGIFPDTEDVLLELPGIGPYTAAAITSIAFGRPAAAVDGNVERVISRFFAITQPLPSSKKTIKERTLLLAANNPSPGDFTQGLMELGSTICTPRKPKCTLCPWKNNCAAFKKGLAESLPKTAPKAKRPVRYGRAYWITDKQGRFLIEKRPMKGLYAGLYQLPTTDWLEDKNKILSVLPFKMTPIKTNIIIRHTFSHFDLVLEIWRGHAAKAPAQKDRRWISAAALDDLALPSLMKKAVKHCLSSLT